MHYADRLAQRIQATSPVCVGLDPMLSSLPGDIDKSVKGVETFCRGIIDAIADIACAVKPQLAYFELLGWRGMKIFFEVCAYARHKNLIVIADGKRNDIGSTCEAYADAYLGKDSPVDALTISPYLGSDGISPFVERCMKNDRGIYVLVKTSNPSSGELQDLPTGDEVVHEYLAQMVESWASAALGEKTRLSCIGAVIGATYSEELKYLRTLMLHVPFLIPGYGTQGATAEDCRPGFLRGGSGAIVSASRSILYASKGHDWQSASRKAAETMSKALRKVLAK